MSCADDLERIWRYVMQGDLIHQACSQMEHTFVFYFEKIHLSTPFVNMQTAWYKRTSALEVSRGLSSLSLRVSVFSKIVVQRISLIGRFIFIKKKHLQTYEQATFTVYICENLFGCSCDTGHPQKVKNKQEQAKWMLVDSGRDHDEHEKRKEQWK